MREKLDKHSLYQRVAALATHQHGVVSRAQLIDLGLTDYAIRRQVRSARLHRVHRGVYAVGHPRLTLHGRFLAAVLRYGDQAVLSHASAAVLWGLLQDRGPRIDLTVPGGGGRARRNAIIVHRSPLPEHHVTVKDSIPVTTPARTVIDLADVSPRRRVERVIDEAAYLGLELDGLRPIHGRRGAGLLRRVMVDHDVGSTRTQSDLEEVMLALCRRFGLAQPRFNTKVLTHLVDCVWDEARLVVETDGWQGHRSRGAFERDRRRDAELTAAGWRVVRITWRRLEQESELVAAQLARLLGRPAALRP
ncbi:MAG: DUF559 domain-containing protein [Thermoleophilaceae bacterium]